MLQRVLSGEGSIAPPLPSVSANSAAAEPFLIVCTHVTLVCVFSQEGLGALSANKTILVGSVRFLVSPEIMLAGESLITFGALKTCVASPGL